MRILYLSQYFPPEAGATQTRAYEMARNLVLLGHRVTILTEFPNHPSGIIPPEYQHRQYERVELDGIDVIRVWVRASPKKNFQNRMLFYLSYMINAFLAGIFLARGKYDLIYASSPPLFVGGSALALSKVKRIPLVFEIRDLWPESAIALGEITSPRAIAWATWLEEKCYSHAESIVVVTETTRSRLCERGINSRKIHLIPNGSNTDLFYYRPDARTKIRTQLGLTHHFIAIYAGILGLAQGLETVLYAAQSLVDTPDIHFFIIGEGPRKEALTDLAANLSLTNLSFLPEKPTREIPDYLSTADIALIPLRDKETFKSVIPSKMFDAWACQRPVILSAPDGEASLIVREAQAGMVISPDNPPLLAEAVKMMKGSDQLTKMGDNGRIFTIKNYSRQAQATMLADLLEGIVHINSTRSS